MLTTIGGTLGLTSAYGVGDPTITRRRVEADLAVFREYRMKYEGMLEACTQQLAWGVERYVKLPPPPEFLELKVAKHPISWWPVLLTGFLLWLMISSALKSKQKIIWPPLRAWANPFSWLDAPLFGLLCILIMVGLFVMFIFFGPAQYFRVKAANGNRPLENARLQKACEEAKAAALKAAGRSKAAEDHRLRVQIRELEGLAKTVGEREADVRRILTTL